MFFSMETMMTIGYGIDDPYFNECPVMLVLVFAQSLVGIFLSSILFGIVLTRVSRADQRARTVAFSDKAIVRAAAIDGHLYLVMRVAEMRKHQLTQAYAHAYAMMDSADVIGDTAAATEGSSVHALPMNLAHPTGEMMLVTPCFIVHRLDAQSPLLPPELTEGADLDTSQRSAADEEGERDGYESRPMAKPGRPSSMPDVKLPQLLRALQGQPHVPTRLVPPAGPAVGVGGAHDAPQTQRAVTPPPAPAAPEVPAAPALPAMSAGAQNDEAAGPGSPRAREATRQRLLQRMQTIREWMVRCNAEVLVLLEGVDATTSTSVQARQSYTVDDICWDATFVPCARRQPDGGIFIDFDVLHDVRPLGHLLPPRPSMASLRR